MLTGAIYWICITGIVLLGLVYIGLLLYLVTVLVLITLDGAMPSSKQRNFPTKDKNDGH